MAIVYIKVDEDTQIAWDDTTRTPRAVMKSALRQELEFLRAQRDALPGQPTNAELLAWAKENYPLYNEVERSRTQIRARIDEIQATLEAMRA